MRKKQLALAKKEEATKKKEQEREAALTARNLKMKQMSPADRAQFLRDEQLNEFRTDARGVESNLNKGISDASKLGGTLEAAKKKAFLNPKQMKTELEKHKVSLQDALHGLHGAYQLIEQSTDAKKNFSKTKIQKVIASGMEVYDEWKKFKDHSMSLLGVKP